MFPASLNNVENKSSQMFTNVEIGNNHQSVILKEPLSSIFLYLNLLSLTF